MITNKILKQLDLIGKVRSGIEFDDLNEEERKIFCDELKKRNLTMETDYNTKKSILVSWDDISYPDPRVLLQQDPSLFGLKTKNFSEMTEEEQKMFTEICEDWEREYKN